MSFPWRADLEVNHTIPGACGGRDDTPHGRLVNFQPHRRKPLGPPSLTRARSAARCVPRRQILGQDLVTPAALHRHSARLRYAASPPAHRHGYSQITFMDTSTSPSAFPERFISISDQTALK